MMVKSILLIVLAGMALAVAGPVPGDIFREYKWTNSGGDAGGALRVGGQYDYGGHDITVPHSIDLTDAVKAEVNVEKILCHDNTRGLSISVNGNAWIPIPEAPGIPSPQYEYQHHIYPNVAVPLSQLTAGTGNKFKMKVDESFGWWPQNLVYGVHFRIYYSASKAHTSGQVTSPAAGSGLGTSVTLRASAQGSVKRIEFVGLHEDFNYEGDNEYRQWHYHFFHGNIMHHLGTANSAGASVTWNTEWVPDQTQPMEIAARIIDDNDVIYMTESVKNLTFARPGLSVKMYKPFNVPKQWVTRKGTKHCYFTVPAGDDLAKANAARMVWVSWSGGYADGILVNGNNVIQRATTNTYQYDYNEVPVPVGHLKTGTNTITTNGTASNVHGMEVNWPGIVMFAQYDASGLALSNASCTPAEVPDSVATSVTLSVDVISNSGNSISSVTVDLSSINGPAAQAMSNTSGNTWTAVYEVPAGLSQGTVQLPVLATDDQGGQGTGTISLKITGIFTGWQDDFNDGNADGWTMGEGSWSVQNNAYANSGSGRTSSWAGQLDWDDISLTADITPGSGTDVWIIFRVQDASNYYLFTLQNGGALYKLVGGSYTKIADASGANFAAGTTYSIEVETSGSSITIYSGGTQILSVSDNQFSAGYVGFGSNGASGTFDNVKVADIGAVNEDNSLGRRPAGGGAGIRLNPNPFTSSVRIIPVGFSAKDIDGTARLAVYDIHGRVVGDLTRRAGHSVSWKPRSRGAGVYWVVLEAGNQRLSKKAIFIK
jgi:hypothetical protein